MEKRGTDKIEDLGVAETPEDVAVLYSWANLHGAKYRDFSASRREYRAQLRHRAAEQVRQQALIAQAEAEAAASVAEAEARKAADAARLEPGIKSDSSIKRNLRNAEEAARTAAAERVEAARRAEAAATAEAAARREEREIADAHASAERQAARYAESEIRRREASMRGVNQDEVPGQITDPYTPQPATFPQGSYAEAVRYQTTPVQQEQRQEMFQPQQTAPPVSVRQPAPVVQQPIAPVQPPAQVVESIVARGTDSSSSQRRRQGYRPDDASGVRQIYRGPEYDAPLTERRATDSGRMPTPSQPRMESQVPRERRTVPEQPRVESQIPPQPAPASPGAGSSASGSGVAGSSSGGRHPFNAQATPRQDVVRGDAVKPAPAPAGVSQLRPTIPPGAPAHNTPPARSVEPAPIAPFWEHSRPVERAATGFNTVYDPNREPAPGSASAMLPIAQPIARTEPAAAPRPVSPFSQPPVIGDPTRGRRAQDDFTMDRSVGFPAIQRAGTGAQPPYFGEQQLPPSPQIAESGPNTPFSADPAGPAWFYAPAASAEPQPQFGNPVQLPSVAETLQHSRERVAARWYALKGVFEQPGETVEQVPVRQKEIRTPVLAVFSLAGGVGKTSLVATIGRSLSSLGEKVLLTDTTSHGLLPFYFGASELRQGTVRTFSPPSGSTDAPIYLVSYDVPTEKAEQPEKEKLVEDILNNNRGTHRIMLDLTVNSAWIIRYMARMNPTVLVPLAPDMNSVISLQAIEKFFQGMVDADGRPLQPYYLINQFDVSLPLHLDVREVLRRQLGDRLLPFVIHRAPEVSEALAEGMTVVDYAPESPVSGDYMNVATWLRTVAAPATAGFRNVRWSER
ncbi:MAG: hypothetical protein JSS95_03690 [Acidobacteria bacterium]|nr:hypothetical protein [Acidobacteriota bacterium]